MYRCRVNDVGDDVYDAFPQMDIYGARIYRLPSLTSLFISDIYSPLHDIHVRKCVICVILLPLLVYPPAVSQHKIDCPPFAKASRPGAEYVLKS
jgi:hypothetical protein